MDIEKHTDMEHIKGFGEGYGHSYLHGDDYGNYGYGSGSSGDSNDYIDYGVGDEK